MFLYVGVGGFDGDGDITKPDNVEEFKEYVLSITNGVGVDFVMADGVSASHPKLSRIVDFSW